MNNELKAWTMNEKHEQRMESMIFIPIILHLLLFFALCFSINMFIGFDRNGSNSISISEFTRYRYYAWNDIHAYLYTFNTHIYTIMHTYIHTYTVCYEWYVGQDLTRSLSIRLFMCSTLMETKAYLLQSCRRLCIKFGEHN